MDAFPLGSKGNKSAMNPETRNSAPETYTGTAVWRLAYSAMIGASKEGSATKHGIAGCMRSP